MDGWMDRQTRSVNGLKNGGIAEWVAGRMGQWISC